MNTHRLGRLAAITPAEARHRAADLGWRLAGRARVALGTSWRREHLRRALAEPAGSDETWRAAVRTVSEGAEWTAAHRVLRQHFSSRTSAFPVDARALGSIAGAIRTTYPTSVADARERALSILAGRYDMLGYRQLEWGAAPDWHLDPVSGRRAPVRYWADIDYLDPVTGDHKVIWELNRHQHWLVLGRAFRLTGEERFREMFVSQLQHWLTANPPLVGVNWASMLELALRSLSWLWALAFFSTDDDRSEVPWTVDLLVGLDRQLLQIERHLSRYFSPNTHLTGEALALYVAGQSLPELAASPRRAALGRAVLLEEIHRQIAPDGGHRERSCHYQRYSTDFYLLAAAVARRSHDSAAHAFEDAARRQARCLRALCDNRGHRPFIGDDDGGQLFPVCGRPSEDCSDTLAIAAALLDDRALATGPVPEEAHWLGLTVPAHSIVPDTRDDMPSVVLPETGYCVSRTRDGHHLIFDVGPHGFLNGGHAHADALSTTLSVHGIPLLVDPGTATYTMDASVRDRFRSTAMHNTVVVNGTPQSVPRGPFHWRTVAHGSARLTWIAAGCEYFEGTHDGYAPIVHTRSILALHGVGWFIVDTLSGSGSAAADVYWHLAPEWRPRVHGGNTVALSYGPTRVMLQSSDPVDILDPAGAGGLADVSRAYGRIERSHTLRARVADSLPLCVLTILTLEASGAHCVVSRLAPAIPTPADWQAWAFEAVLPAGRATLLYALERTGIASSAAAAPGVDWGLPELQTDARVALYLQREGGAAEAVLVNGARLQASGRRLIDRNDRVPLLRTALRPGPATAAARLAPRSPGQPRAVGIGH
jgi:hypothetical protein